MQKLEVRPGVFIRYLRMGRGQPLLLLHTIRTQLEYFERLAPLLADRYAVRSGWIVAPFALFRQFTLEPRFLLNLVLAGGFRDPRSFPESLARKFFRSGQRAGYRWVEYSVFANWRSWIEARKHFVPDAGHFASLEAPREIAAIIAADSAMTS